MFSTRVERVVFVVLGLGVVALAGLVLIGRHPYPQPQAPISTTIGTTGVGMRPASPESVQTAPTATPSPPTGEVRENPRDGLRYVWIPPGTFQMGCSPGDGDCDPNESPRHQVTISRGFWLGETEVTVGAYKYFCGRTSRGMPEEPRIDGPSLNPGWSDESQPISMVTWNDAVAYCQWAGGRLPTEAEWEYAARAGTTGPHYGHLDSVAWYGDNSGQQRLDSRGIDTKNEDDYLRRVVENQGQPHLAGRKHPNSFGLYDMLGNVAEWTADWYSADYYRMSQVQDPRGPTNGERRVVRGGCWFYYLKGLRVSFRQDVRPDRRDSIFGFRCALEVSP